ncbi:MAG: tripartite tricarboxylate transporter permease [Rhodospirillales bacterium]|jgi:putative tricarboxylic transport membrane protein|nr:tripartite tricarboxylate transporter permease [Rhodospirillales bacterium]MBT4039996.1 tripartite tricarboxylate transporter permease [Rhodospirillales bacterium]MBT4625834.1 tripartite tricarboxylate transporter permease [Rhodospirillales bacterium]MBT5351658.1 tripartite tricarboxylate transporter permease [Rhodospirillales bacterium]MBT5521335.1 tripartite tricarboxylate transporter permease [Rhodospirillales bacterium]
MELLGNLADGFFIAFEPLNLGLMIVGVIVGLFIGAMPGLGSVNGVAILLPMTFLVPPTSAIIFLAAIYYGAMYGGAISSIMLGIPGASTAVATTFDGRPLALKGEADKALIGAAMASFVGGTISIILFTLFAPPLAKWALAFGDHELFALMMMAFATFVGLSGDDIPKTLFSICIGLVLSSVGLDIMSGEPRLVFFDIIGFMHGINFLVLAIGVYGIGEMLWTIETTRGEPAMSKAKVSVERVVSNLKEISNTWVTALMASFVGFFVGILPAAGATPGSLMSYGFAKTYSKTPEEFGKGKIDGVVAPEAANNAASTGAMLPMLTLGIPGSPTTAILLGGMVIWGLVPGPMLFIEQEEFVWGLIASLYAANLFAAVINIGFIPMFLWMLKMPFSILAPIIFVLCIIGGFAPTQSMHDVWLMYGFGVVAFLMRKLDYPLAPAVLAIVLGPLAEPSLRQSLLISNGDITSFFTRPISGTFMAFAIFLLALPIIKAVRARSANKGSASA